MHGITINKNGNRKIPISEYLNVCLAYQNGISTTNLAQKYNVHPATIRLILQHEGIKIRQGGSTNTDEDISLWKELYTNGMSLKDIAKQCNVSAVTVSKNLKKNNVNIDRFTYHCNECYFDNIETEEQAYFLGMLWADGSNVLDKRYITLSLQEKDKDLLDRLNSLMENERPLHFNNLNARNSSYQNQYVAIWSGEHLVHVLDNLGMHQNKTLILEYPACLDESLCRHFIRGYFDGDGSISLTNNNRSANTSMVGTRMLLNKMADMIKQYVGVSVSVRQDARSKDPICNLRCTRIYDNILLLNWIYEDAHIFLQRKYDKYQQFLNAHKT